MRRWLNRTGVLLGLLLFVALLVAIAMTWGGGQGKQSAGIFLFQLKSPIQTPMSLPLGSPTAPPVIAATEGPQSTFPPPMSAKATTIALAGQSSSESRTSHTYPIHSPQDVIDAVLTDPGFQANLDDPLFGPNSNGATPMEPVLVRNLSDARPDYYIVPFRKDGLVTGLAVVNVEGGMGKLGMWSNADDLTFPAVSADEAKSLVEQRGLTVEGTPRPVFRMLIEDSDKTAPFWEVQTTSGAIYYVIPLGYITEVYRSDEVHPTD